MDIPFDVLNIVASFVVKPKMKLLDWIQLDKLNINRLSENEGAINFLERHPAMINWDYLSLNENAIHMLEANPKKINWENLTANPKASTILKTHPDGLDHLIEAMEWDDLFYLNQDLINLIEAFLERLIQRFRKEALIKFIKNVGLNLIEVNPTIHKNIMKYICDNCSHFTDEDFGISDTKTNWDILSMSPQILTIMEEHPNLINKAWLSGKCNSERAFKLLEKYPEKIDWSHLSSNPYEQAFALLEKYPDKIDWKMLSRNSNKKAIKLLEKHCINPHVKIDWDVLVYNSGIFEIDMKQLNIDTMSMSKKIDLYIS